MQWRQTTCFFKSCGSIIRPKLTVRGPKPGQKSRPAEAVWCTLFSREPEVKRTNMETFQRPELKERPAKNHDTDKAALQAIAQAAIDVELFTLPLYMVSMYSIQGMHQITSKGNDFYRGRLWPGASPAREPASSPNAAAFNHFFSVFIDEMLHLQLASNIAKALGVMPSYNS